MRRSTSPWSRSGLGGTWDATNVADAGVAVVTPIDVDHAHLLGDTITKIATEKAGIIKPGAHAILAGQSLEAAQVLLERCAEVGALPQREGIDFGVLDRQLGGRRSADPAQRRRGAGRRRLPAAARRAPGGQRRPGAGGGRGFPGPQGAATRTWPGRASPQVQFPGRMEVVRRSPTVVLDAAHNPHGARATAAAVTEAFGFTPLIGVVAVMADKDARGMLTVFEEIMNQVVVTQVASTSRGMPADELGELAAEIFGAERVQRRPAARRRDRDGGHGLAESRRGRRSRRPDHRLGGRGRRGADPAGQRGAGRRDPTRSDDPDDDWDADYSENGEEPDREQWS